MSRIKFRAWDKDWQRMIVLGSHGALRYDDEAAKLVFGEDFHDDFSTTRTGNFELMQFTGLKDRDGREIYEGDIVTHPAIKRTGPVVYRDAMACFVVEHQGGTTTLNFAALSEKPWEIIGNIYENPERLEVTG